MLRVCLKEGAPDEPDSGDWDAICAAPSISGFFGVLFQEVAHSILPGEVITSETEDFVQQVRTGWRGNRELGTEITVVSCVETTDFPTYCSWETHGLPGMKVRWDYKLEYAGQLGHVAFRHGRLECWFLGTDDQQRFSEIWKKVIGKDLVLEPCQ